ncbi:hypothetical protein [Streptomyces sp. NPDC091383]|uniref:hypothetical protein n=1 Tax=Streptomyces sp. NPDC091383 TaxID=3365996 RepID=UPI003804A479
MAATQLRRQQPGAAGRRIFGTQDYAVRIIPQHAHRKGDRVERHPGQGDIDQSGTLPAGGVGRMGVTDTDVDVGVASVVGGGRPGHAPAGAVTQDADGEGRDAGRRAHPYPEPIGMLEQPARLAEQRVPTTVSVTRQASRRRARPRHRPPIA